MWLWGVCTFNGAEAQRTFSCPSLLKRLPFWILVYVLKVRVTMKTLITFNGFVDDLPLVTSELSNFLLLFLFQISTANVCYVSIFLRCLIQIEQEQCKYICTYILKQKPSHAIHII